MTDAVSIALITACTTVATSTVAVVQTWFQERIRQRQTAKTLHMLPESVASKVMEKVQSNGGVTSDPPKEK